MVSARAAVGIDIDERLIDYARGDAQTGQVSDRVEFQAMDALLPLAFPDTSFDLVNLRLGASFIRTWEWPQVLREIARVTRPQGVLRITELEIINQSSSPALLQVGKMLMCAFFQSWHFFEQAPTGITAHLERLLQGHGYQQIQTMASTIESRAGTAGGQALYEDMVHSFQAMRPFIQKWGCDDAEQYDLRCQQARAEMQQSGAYSTWNFLTVWGNRF
jgi:ubiquinone/menaquinone biosynthesis C-methylase UbiE